MTVGKRLKEKIVDGVADMNAKGIPWFTSVVGTRRERILNFWSEPSPWMPHAFFRLTIIQLS